MIFKVSSFTVEEESYQKANPSPVNKVLGISFPRYKLSTGCSGGGASHEPSLCELFTRHGQKFWFPFLHLEAGPAEVGSRLVWRENGTADSEPRAEALWWSRDHVRFFLCSTVSHMPGSVSVHHVMLLWQRRVAACSGCVVTSGLKLVCSHIELLFSLLIMKQQGKLGLQLLASRTALVPVNPSGRSDLRGLGQSCIC